MLKGFQMDFVNETPKRSWWCWQRKAAAIVVTTVIIITFVSWGMSHWFR
jgi:hypothetical protein